MILEEVTGGKGNEKGGRCFGIGRKRWMGEVVKVWIPLFGVESKWQSKWKPWPSPLVPELLLG